MPPIHAVVANPSLLKNVYFRERFFEGFYRLKNWSSIQIQGKDATRFLQGQLSSDVQSLTKNKAQLSTRLDRNGRVMSYFYLSKEKDSYRCLIPNHLKKGLLEDLEKYIIMDDVLLSSLPTTVTVVWSLTIPPGVCKAPFGGESGYLLWDDNHTKWPGKEIDGNIFWQISLLNGYPAPEYYAPEGQLLNETLLNIHGVSYKKGCFLGQETVAKIETRRGAAFFPVVLLSNTAFSDEDLLLEEEKVGKIIYSFKKDDCFVALVSLKRRFRIDGKSYTFTQGGEKRTATVHYIPFFKESKAKELYTKGVSVFQEDKEEEALELLQRVVQIDPSFADAYESIGVILGRLKRYDEGIKLMDKVLEVNPDSVLAHTNKSLFLMNLGCIEEAEKEKSLATVKTFEQYGKEAKAKKDREKQNLLEEERMNEREKMFLQVLDIDPEDAIALYGLAEIRYKRGHFLEAAHLLDRLLINHTNYSRGYTLLGKTYIALDKPDDAVKILNKGIQIATDKGELMPANEMQELLNSFDRKRLITASD